MYRMKAAVVLCLALIFAAAGSSQTDLATAKGLNGKWVGSFDWKGQPYRVAFIFEVKDDVTPAPDARVRFTGTHGSPESPKNVHFTDGEMIGNQFAFTTTEKKGKEWKEDQVVSAYSGSFKGDQMTMILFNLEPRDPANPNKVEHGPHREPPPHGWINMHIITLKRVSK